MSCICRPALPSRLQLSELHQLLGACEALSHLAESAGARPVLTLRNAVQASCSPCSTLPHLSQSFAFSKHIVGSKYAQCVNFDTLGVVSTGAMQNLLGRHALPQLDTAHR